MKGKKPDHIIFIDIQKIVTQSPAAIRDTAACPLPHQSNAVLLFYGV